MFFIDAVKFLVIIAVLIIGLYFGLLWKMILLDYDPTLIALRLGDAIVWILPPNLVTVVNLTMTATLSRLKLNNILGTQPDKTLEASQTEIICFDKTGTLTTNKIKVKYVFDEKNNKIQSISDIVKKATKLQFIFQVQSSFNLIFNINLKIFRQDY